MPTRRFLPWRGIDNILRIFRYKRNRISLEHRSISISNQLRKSVLNTRRSERTAYELLTNRFHIYQLNLIVVDTSSKFDSRIIRTCPPVYDYFSIETRFGKFAIEMRDARIARQCQRPNDANVVGVNDHAIDRYDRTVFPKAIWQAIHRQAAVMLGFYNRLIGIFKNRTISTFSNLKTFMINNIKHILNLRTVEGYTLVFFIFLKNDNDFFEN